TGSSPTPNTPPSQYISHSNGCKKTMQTTPVNTLKNTWAAANRRALLVAPITTKIDLNEVPMLAPITTAAASTMLMLPLAKAVRTKATGTAELMIIDASTMPTSTITNTPYSCPSCTSLPRALKPVESTSMPSNSKPKPDNASPKDLLRSLRPSPRSMAPIPITGKAKASI